MKILHLTTHLNIGGIASYIRMIGLAMSKRGHRIHVVSSGGTLEADLRQKGILCHTLPIRTKNEIHPKLLGPLGQITRLLKREKFDLIHAHTRVAEVLAFLAGSWAKIPVVSTAHGFYTPNLGRKIFPCWGRRVIAISPMVAEALVRHHRIALSRVKVVQNALDIGELQSKLRAQDPRQVRKEYGVPESAIVVGSVSRLVRDKGHEFLIQALGLLRRDFPGMFLIIVGDGREKGRLQILAQEQQLSERVKFISGLTDITGLLSTMDIFVHPATFREGFGFSIAEAMIARKPVVATNIPAINSIIENRVNGILVEPKDAGALADAVSFLLKNEEEKRRIAEGGFQMASRLCSLDRMVNGIEEVYREVLSESHSGGRG